MDAPCRMFSRHVAASSELAPVPLNVHWSPWAQIVLLVLRVAFFTTVFTHCALVERMAHPQGDGEGVED